MQEGSGVYTSPFVDPDEKNAFSGPKSLRGIERLVSAPRTKTRISLQATSSFQYFFSVLCPILTLRTASAQEIWIYKFQKPYQIVKSER